MKRGRRIIVLLTLSVQTSGPRLAGRGGAVVRLLAEPAPVARPAQTGECPQAVHTLRTVLAAVVLAVINVLLAVLAWSERNSCTIPATLGAHDWSQPSVPWFRENLYVL